MPAGRGLFSPAGGGPRSVTRTPHDYISPATRRQKGVVPSPAAALFDTASTFMGESTMNDDEAERKERRRSRVLELRRNLHSPAVPADRRLSEPLSGLTNVQLTEHYTNCIKLSAENKINAKNAFGLHLIDYMSELLKKKEMNNFQVASSTLDASAKIYAGRVDAVHSETYKVLSGLGRGVDRSSEQTQGEEGVGEEGMAEAGAEQPEQGKEKKRKRARKSNTIETNIKNINVNKFDLEFEVDPLFSKTSAAFDEGGTGGLLLNHLRCLDDAAELVLDSNTIVTNLDEMPPTDTQQERGSRMLDLAEFRSMYSGVNLDAIQICPAFADFEFMNWNRDGEDVFSMMNTTKSGSQSDTSLHNKHAFDLDAEVEPIPEAEAMLDMPGPGGDAVDGGMDNFDDFACADDADDAVSVGASEADRSVRDFCVGDNQAAKIFNKAMQDIKHGTVGTLMQVLAQEPSDYSYFKSNLLRTWAGPGHWKPVARSTASSARQSETETKKRKDKKNDIFTINYKEDTEFDSLFKESRASTTLTKATLDRYSKSQTTLPEDLHYDADKLFKLFEKPKLMIQRFESKSETSDEGVSNYDYDNDIDRENFCPASQQDDDDNDDNDGGFELTNYSDNVFSQDANATTNMTAMDGTLLGDKLVHQPRKVEKLDIGYAKVAKKVDVKKVKNSMWSILTKPETVAEGEKSNAMDTTEQSSEDKTLNPEESKMDQDSTSKNTTVTDPSSSTGVAGSHSFQTMLSTLPTKVSRTMAKNLSVPIAFVCLLHLANEKTLEITSDETMADLKIKQG